MHSISGPKTRSLFSKPPSWTAQPDLTRLLSASLDEMRRHVDGVDNDRLLVLLGALLLENRVDALLCALSRGFRSVREDRDFTFALKLKLLLAMRLIPSRIVRDADFIRDIRNKFAHKLSVTSLSLLPKSLTQGASDRLHAYHVAVPAEPREVLRQLIVMAGFGLSFYSHVVADLSRFLHKNDLEASIRAFVEHHGA